MKNSYYVIGAIILIVVIAGAFVIVKNQNIEQANNNENLSVSFNEHIAQEIEATKGRCMNITNQTEQTACFIDYAVETKNISICNNVPNPRPEAGDFARCTKEVYIAIGDSSNCGLLYYSSDRRECLSSI